MDTISDRNPRVVSALKLVKASERRATGLFLAEGANAASGAIDSGVARELFVSAEAAARYTDIIGQAHSRDIRVWQISDRVANGLSETVTPQGVVAVCEQSRHTLDRVLSAAGESAFVAVLIDVNDPGNAGAIIRVADAAGAHAVLLLGESVDPYNGKVIRATAGSFFHIPVVRARNTADALDRMRKQRFLVLATTAQGDVALSQLGLQPEIGPQRRVAWLLGNEAHGLPPGVLSVADLTVRIPIFGRAESLNLATAGALCLYESARLVRRE